MIPTVTKKIVVEQIDKLFFRQMKRENLLEKVNSYQTENGDIVFSVSFYNYGDDCANGYLEVQIERLETDNEFCLRIANEARLSRNKEQEDFEKYKRLKLRFENKSTE